MIKLIRAWAGIAACACAGAGLLAAEGVAEGSKVDALVVRLGASDVAEREKAREELAKLAAGLSGQEQKDALKRLAEAARSHADMEVREKAQAVLAPYAGGAALWESAQSGSRFNGMNQMEVIPEGIVAWGVNAQGNSFLRILDVKTGKPVWEKKPSELPGGIGVVRSGPEGLFVGGSCGQERSWFAVYDPKTGKTVRERILKGIGGGNAFGGGQNQFLEAEKDYILLSHGGMQGGQIGRFDGQTGGSRWIREVEGQVTQAQGDKDVLLYSAVEYTFTQMGQAPTMTSRVACLDAATGKTLWEQRSEPGNRWRQAKLAGDGVAVVEVEQGAPSKLVYLDRKSGKPAWEAELPAGSYPVVMEPAAGGLLVFAAAQPGGTSFARLYDAKDGSVKWDLSKQSAGIPATGKLTPEGLLVAGTGDGKSWLALIDPATGKTVWEKKLQSEDPIQGFEVGPNEAVTWTVARGQGQASTLNAFDLKTGEKKWSRDWNGWLQTVKLLPAGILAGGFDLSNGWDQKSILGLYRLGGVWEE